MKGRFSARFTIFMALLRMVLYFEGTLGTVTHLPN